MMIGIGIGVGMDSVSSADVKGANTLWVSYTLSKDKNKNDSAEEQRYQERRAKLIDELKKYSLNGYFWDETTSFFLLKTRSSLDVVKDSVEKIINTKTDLVLLHQIAKPNSHQSNDGKTFILGICENKTILDKVLKLL